MILWRATLVGRGVVRMTYFRLRDIKTPPFAYVVNKEEIIHSCDLCQMPYAEPKGTLEVEIFTTELHEWESRLKGKPLMAEEWLIGDAYFKAVLDECLPGLFNSQKVKIVSWMTRRPDLLVTEPSDMLTEKKHSEQPDYYYFRPAKTLSLDERLRNSFPPIRCNACDREIPEIPLEYQRLPDLSGEQPLIASLEHFHLEGYDYLFHEKAVNLFRERFPRMMMEELASESLMI